MTTCIIAEKPSVARDIARIVGATSKQDGYMEGCGYIVTWAMGHLIALAMPEAYGFSTYKAEDLPIRPNPFQLVVRQVRKDKEFVSDPAALKQLKVIRSCFDKADRIIVATDAGREGELIFRYIYQYLDCKKTFERLWISSLTDKAIREGLSNLKSGIHYDNLYHSAKARSEADWLVGINASRALSIARKGGYSLGRVQTPTLAMVCRRYIENRDFSSVPYWKLSVLTEKEGLSIKAIGSKDYESKASAQTALALLRSQSQLKVESVTRKVAGTTPPLLYDLTALQKDANRRHGFSADKTLSIAQSLYEKKITTYPRKMSLDLRMIDENAYSDHIDNKASHCAKMLNDYYQKFDAQKGTQFVFSDLGTYKPGGDFNVYSEIKRKLVEDYHIPSYEIRFIQECKNEKAKKAMVDAMNRGDIRIIFGSTSMLGTGVNAQQRAVAVHHLDTPWRPSDLEQRNGRAVRKGNLIAKEFADNKVDVIIYAVERSLDSYKFNLLHNKQLFINQLKSNQLGSRTIDEGSMDEDSGMNFSEYVAVLSGNTDLLEKARLDKKITTLESERKNFLRERDAATGKLAEIESSVSFHSDKIKEAQSDLTLFEQRVERDEEGTPINKLTIKGVEDSTDIKAIAARLQEIDEKARTNGEYNKIGEIYGFSIMVKTESTSKDLFDCSVNRFFVKGQESIYYTYNNGKLATDPKLACQNFVNALERIPKVIESHEKEMAKVLANKDVYTNIANSSWKKEDELRALKGKAADLDRKIALTLSPPEEEQDAKDEMKQGEGLSGNNHSVGKGNDNLSVQDAEEEKHSQSFKPKWRHYP